MSRLVRLSLACLTVVAVGLVATAAWAQDATPTPTPSPSGGASPSPSATPSPSPSPTPTPSESPSPTPTASESPSPTPSPTAGPPPDSTPSGGGSDIGLQIDPSSSAVQVGDRLTIDVVVTNGTADPQDLTLAVELPEELGFVSSEPPGTVVAGGPPPAGESIAVDLGTIPAGGSQDASLLVEGLDVGPPAGVEIDFGVSGSITGPSDSLLLEVLESDDRVPTLELTAHPPPAFVAGVGERLTYGLTVRNTGDDALENVIVVERVPPEVTVVAAPLVDGVDAVQVGRFLEREDVVWVMEKLGAGESVRLPWQAVVQSAGDLEATTDARATADRSTPATASGRNFLASPAAPEKPVNPPFTPIRERVVVTVPAERAPGTLPFTGLQTWVWAVIGGLTMLAGFALYRFGSPFARGKRVPATLALLCILTAACVSSSDDQQPRATGTPEVKGRRIERGEDPVNPAPEPGQNEDGEESASGNDGNDDAPSDENDDDGPADPEPIEPDTDEVPEVEPEPDSPTETDEPAETVTRVIVREVGLADLPVREATATTGGSTSFAWDEGARSITPTASSVFVRPDAPVSVVTTVHDNGGSVSVDVSLLNDSDDERLAVRGTLVHEVSTGGTVATLSSDPIDTVLSPGGRVTTTFTYLLPSGSYSAGGSFVAG